MFYRNENARVNSLAPIIFNILENLTKYIVKKMIPDTVS